MKSHIEGCRRRLISQFLKLREAQLQRLMTLWLLAALPCSLAT